jgi:hypothetical protein
LSGAEFGVDAECCDRRRCGLDIGRAMGVAWRSTSGASRGKHLWISDEVNHGQPGGMEGLDRGAPLGAPSELVRERGHENG